MEEARDYGQRSTPEWLDQIGKKWGWLERKKKFAGP